MVGCFSNKLLFNRACPFLDQTEGGNIAQTYKISRLGANWPDLDIVQLAPLKTAKMQLAPFFSIFTIVIFQVYIPAKMQLAMPCAYLRCIYLRFTESQNL